MQTLTLQIQKSFWKSYWKNEKKNETDQTSL